MPRKMNTHHRVWVIICLLFILELIVLGIFHFRHSSEKNTEYNLHSDDSQSLAHTFKLSPKDSQDAFNLAMAYWDGKGQQQDRLQAKAWLIKSADAGNPNALYNLGAFRYLQLLVDNPDDPFGYRSLEKAADLGNSRAQVFIGIRYYLDDKNILPEDLKKARHYITLAAKQNEPFGLYAYAGILEQEDQNSQEAVKILTPLINDGFLLAAYPLASIYEEGKNGVEKNPQLAKQYSDMFNELLKYANEETFNPPPLPISMFSVLTPAERVNKLSELESLAKEGNSDATYQLFNIYNLGDGVIENKSKAVDYLEPLIDKKDPQALYLRYIVTRKNPDNIITAADNGYAPAAYYLYRVYSYYAEDNNFKHSSALAAKYLHQAAELGNKEAMSYFILSLLEDSNYPNPQLNQQVTLYANKLLADYPNDPMALTYASYVYYNEHSEIYNPSKAFELMQKAFDISPESYLRLNLAHKYAYGIGTAQNLEKAVQLYNENIIKFPADTRANRYLTELFYSYDLTVYLDEQIVIKYILDDIKNKNYYLQAHHYADYLLRTDAKKNYQQAFELYEKHNDYNLNAKIHYAIALIKYQKGQQSQAIALIDDVLNNKEYKDKLSDKELNAAYEILMGHALNNSTAKKLLLTLAVNKSYPKAEEYALSLVGKDPDITFQYAIEQLKKINNIDEVSDEQLKSDYDLIFKAADLGSSDASLYIAQNIQGYESARRWPYFSQRFKKITGLQENTLTTWLEKCADLGENDCWYQLGNIFEMGKYKNPVDYQRALSYYQQVTAKKHLYVQSHIDGIKKVLAEFDEYKTKAANGDGYANLVVADAYKNGKFGQLIDNGKWLKYIDRSAMLGNQPALVEIIRYYDTDSLQEKDRQKLLNYYLKAVEIGDNFLTYKLATHYFYGNSFVSANRNKAKKFYEKSGSSGQEYFDKMEQFDVLFSQKENDPHVLYEIGNAYYYGNGVPYNTIKAKNYFHQAAKKGDEDGLLAYVELLKTGVVDKRTESTLEPSNWDEAALWLKKIPDNTSAKDDLTFYQSTILPAQNGDGAKALELGYWYARESNTTEALHWFNTSYQAGNIEAIRPLILNSNIDTAEQKKLLQSGVDKGDLFSIDRLAQLIISSPEVATDSKEYQTVITGLESNLHSNDEGYQYRAYSQLEELYGNGITIDNQLIREKSPKKYVALLEQQSDTRVSALYNLYFYYSDSDFNKAISYLDKAAKIEPKEATYKLFLAYYPYKNCSNKNMDIKKTDQFLKTWLTLSGAPKMEQTYRPNAYAKESKNLGDIYFNGDCDIPENLDKAIEWYQISLDNHPYHAAENIYEAYLIKQDAEQAYYYALVLQKNMADITLFEQLSQEKKEIIKARLQKNSDK